MRTHPPAVSAPARFGCLLFVVMTAGLIGCATPVAKLDRTAQAPPAIAAPAPSPRDSSYVVIRLAKRRLELMEEGVPSPVASFPIAVGRPGHETPTGRFQVEELVEHPEFHKIDPNDRSRILKHFPPGPANPLGERWIGFAHGDGWTVGIHGTPNPELLGRAVSGGCIRMRNADVLRVYETVELGTPVIVHP
jgi:L,D-transpeptidase ErfK/SrfK